MKKTEVYSWRLSPDLKEALQEVAQDEGKSLATLLEEMAEERLASVSRRPEDEAREQEHLRARALRYVGAIRGGDPLRAEQVRERLRERLARTQPYGWVPGDTTICRASLRRFMNNPG